MYFISQSWMFGEAFSLVIFLDGWLFLTVKSFDPSVFTENLQGGLIMLHSRALKAAALSSIFGNKGFVVGICRSIITKT